MANASQPDSGLQDTEAPGLQDTEARRLQELTERAQSGDREALEQLLTQLAPKLRRFGLRLCRSHADDALQEALVTISQKLGDYRGGGNISSWGYSIVRSACGRQTRGLDNAAKLPLSDAHDQLLDEPSPEQSLLGAEEQHALECALMSLPIEQREVVLLRDIEQVGTQQAAGILELSVPALKSRLHRGRTALAEALLASGKQGHGGGCAQRVECLRRRLQLRARRAEAERGAEGERGAEAERCAGAGSVEAGSGSQQLEAQLMDHLRQCEECTDCSESLERALGRCQQLPGQDGRGDGWRDCVRRLLGGGADEDARALSGGESGRGAGDDPGGRR